MAGELKTFTLINRPPPGGLGFTIGFWKNWSSCTGGGQKPTLDITLSSAEPAGITVGLLTLHGSTTSPLRVLDSQNAVDILNKSTIEPKSQKMASDPAYNLASQLLAADLNVQSGAGSCSASTLAITQAQSLLAAIGFKGTVAYAKGMTAAQTTLANSLATTLDSYNNNKLCN